MSYLTDAEKAAIDKAWAADYGEPDYSEPVKTPSAAAIGKVMARHHAAAKQRRRDEHTLGRPLPAYPDELGDLALRRLAEMQVTPELVEPHGERFNFDMNRPIEAVRADINVLESNLEADSYEARADALRSRVNRDADGNVVAVSQRIKLPEPR